jgi:hypothetical protein
VILDAIATNSATGAASDEASVGGLLFNLRIVIGDILTTVCGNVGGKDGDQNSVARTEKLVEFLDVCSIP